MSDALSNLKDHAPTLPSASDVRDAVQAHMPSVDLEAVRSKAKGKWSIAMLLGAVAAVAVLLSSRRRRSNDHAFRA